MANRLRVKKIERVSLVGAGDDPNAVVVLAKADETVTKETCKTCGGNGKIRGNKRKCPDCKGGGDVHTQGMKKSDEGGTTDSSGVSTLALMSAVNKVGRKMSSKRRKALEDATQLLTDVLTETQEDPGMSKAAEVEKVELPEDTPEEVVKYVEALEGLVVEAAEAITKAEADDDDDEGDDTDDEGGEPTAKSADDIVKNAPPEIQAIIKASEERAEAATKAAEEASEIAKAERDHRLTAEFIAKAESLPHLTGETTEKADLLKSVAAKVTPEEFAALDKMLKAANDSLKESALLEEVGKSAHEASGGAYEKIVKMAQERIEKHTGDGNPPTEAQMIAKIAQENPSLYAEYQAEMKER